MTAPQLDAFEVKRSEVEQTSERGRAIFSDDGRYRYSLSREWGPSPLTLVVVGLNPSTADARVDDMTIRKCVAFARRRGCDRLRMLNLFAYRATDPRELRGAEDPVGPLNDHHLVQVLTGIVVQERWPVLAAWGSTTGLAKFTLLRDRVRMVRKLLPAGQSFALGLTRDGSPRHPSRIGYDVEWLTFPR